MAVNFNLLSSSKDKTVVKNSKVWKKTYERVLSEEQRQAYRRAVLDRQVRFKKAAIAQIVARFDQDLLLSPKQREEVEKIVKANIRIKSNTRSLSGETYRLKNEVRKQMKDSLSKAQLASLKTNNPFAQVIELDDFGGGGNHRRSRREKTANRAIAR